MYRILESMLFQDDGSEISKLNDLKGTSLLVIVILAALTLEWPSKLAEDCCPYSWVHVLPTTHRCSDKLVNAWRWRRSVSQQSRMDIHQPHSILMASSLVLVPLSHSCAFGMSNHRFVASLHLDQKGCWCCGRICTYWIGCSKPLRPASVSVQAS
jgi:hypothetical protein